MEKIKDYIKLEISQDKLDLLKKYVEEVLEVNKTMNLTSITDKEEFLYKHIIDSLMITNYFDLKNKSIVDVGTGGGFPGMVLAIVYPESKFTLIDSSNKKINFIKSFVEKNNMTNVKLISGRAEEQKINADVVVSRAVASLNVLVEISSNLVKQNGEMILYKSKSVDQELEHMPDYIDELGLLFMEKIDFKVREDERNLILFSKEHKNRKDYPREFNQIKGKPL